MSKKNHLEIQTPELPFEVEEAMNRLRVNVKFSGSEKRKIMIASSTPDEGKSTVAVYLWKMMAEAGFKTVLVDLDLRKSMLKERYNVAVDKDMKGVNYYLSGLADLDEVIYETNVENGYIVPCLNLLENPSSLLEDPSLKKLLNELAREYRYVIIDSPPLQNVSDGTLIASKCDGVILVVRCGYTSKRDVRDSIKQVERAGSQLLGTVLNRAETDRASYKKYYSGYGRYYRYQNYSKNS